jgi:hypothetical protein
MSSSRAPLAPTGERGWGKGLLVNPENLEPVPRTFEEESPGVRDLGARNLKG